MVLPSWAAQLSGKFILRDNNKLLPMEHFQGHLTAGAEFDRDLSVIIEGTLRQCETGTMFVKGLSMSLSESKDGRVR